MAFRGRFQLGEEVPLAVLCQNASGAPTAPDAAPTADVWSASARVKTFSLPVLDVAVTGLFGKKLFLGADYAAGLYRVFYAWATGSGAYHGLLEDTFEVVAGGHADGAVVALYGYKLPQATYLVQQLDSGKLVRGKNPRV